MAESAETIQCYNAGAQGQDDERVGAPGKFYLSSGRVLRCPINPGQLVVQEQGYILVKPPIFKLVTVTAWTGKAYSCAPTNTTGLHEGYNAGARGLVCRVGDIKVVANHRCQSAGILAEVRRGRYWDGELAAKEQNGVCRESGVVNVSHHGRMVVRWELLPVRVRGLMVIERTQVVRSLGETKIPRFDSIMASPLSLSVRADLDDDIKLVVFGSAPRWHFWDDGVAADGAGRVEGSDWSWRTLSALRNLYYFNRRVRRCQEV
ncbi:hypothetical protein BDQ17DRAFT_1427336 [Cyathus striatus]|nr:hypothetical protein BDQ17DRAFT_1427336 [Cyathus striatus]